MPRLTNPFTWAAELIDKGFSVQDALRKVDVPFWDDLRFPAANLKAGTAGVPTWDNTNGLQEFSIGDYLFCQVQLPHAL